MTINVTREDIDLGERGSGQRCAVARAIQRTLKDSRLSEVGNFWIHFYEPGGTLTKTDTPSHVRNFIREYDAGFPVSPISFELELDKQQTIAEPIPEPELVHAQEHTPCHSLNSQNQTYSAIRLLTLRGIPWISAKYPSGVLRRTNSQTTVSLNAPLFEMQTMVA